MQAANATYKGYSNNTFPTSSTTVLAANYYDNYDFDFNGTADYTYDNAHLSGQDATESVRTRGLPTGSTRVIMNSDETLGSWLITAVFYDQYDRPIQVLGNNPQYTAGLDKQTTIYDFVKAIKTKTTHRSSASVALDIVDHADYDHAGRVKVLYRKIGSGTDQVVTEYVYNSLGQLSQKKLHKKPDNSFLQTVDLAYTIAGELKKINDRILLEKTSLPRNCSAMILWVIRQM